MNIGKSIKVIRKKRGMTQAELSQKTGLSQTSLSQVESGAFVPTTNSIQKICEALNVSPALLYIFGIEDTDVPEENKALYSALMPSFKALANQVFEKRNDTLIE